MLDALEAAIPALDAAGFHHQVVWEVGCPYISSARATMLRKALDAKADVIVFIDHDVSFRPEDLVRLIQTEGDVVAGLYRFKVEAEEYMGGLETLADGLPIVRDDGCIKAVRVPAGFLKITAMAVHRFIKAYPHLTFGPSYSPSVDLFNHGAHEGAWYGEDYAFSRNWLAQGGEIWVVPDLDLTHHTGAKPYPGNYFNFLRRQPGGDLEGK
jgi:glycosyltransferase involved in cell wall biosynthesis